MQVRSRNILLLTPHFQPLLSSVFSLHSCFFPSGFLCCPVLQEEMVTSNIQIYIINLLDFLKFITVFYMYLCSLSFLERRLLFTIFFPSQSISRTRICPLFSTSIATISCLDASKNLPLASQLPSLPNCNLSSTEHPV